MTRICHVARLFVAEGHEAVDGDVIGQVEHLLDFGAVEQADPAGAEPQVVGLEHHVGEHDGSVDEAVAPVTVLGVCVHEGGFLAEAADEHGGRVEAAGRALVDLGEVFGFGDDPDALGLGIACRGSDATGFQDGLDVLFGNGFVGVFADRVAVLDELLVFHGSLFSA